MGRALGDPSISDSVKSLSSSFATTLVRLRHGDRHRGNAFRRSSVKEVFGTLSRGLFHQRRTTHAPFPPAINASTLAITALSMVAFAANSLLIRAALVDGYIDPASLTAIRIGAGAVVLLPVLRNPSNLVRDFRTLSSWKGAFSLLAYATLFSFGYVGLNAGTGALLAFGAVQVTMVAVAALGGERPTLWGLGGIGVATTGLVLLVLPGLSAPPVGASALMLGAGASWGLYSHFGRRQRENPAGQTARNFLKAALLVGPLLALYSVVNGPASLHATPVGILFGVASGAVTSALGYVLWYRALRGLTATTASAVQLSAPFLAAVGGIALLGETFHLRLLAGGLFVLGGIALSLRRTR